MSMISIFREVRDPRDPNARHALPDILFVTLAGMLCGAKTIVDVADFTGANLQDLQEVVPLSHGAPSHDTFSRVFRLLDPLELSGAFASFMAELRQGLGLAPPGGVVAVDGKALRRGYEKGAAHLPPLMVNVLDGQTRLAIASARAPGGSEVKATLALLKGLNLKGCTVTADALHCHPAMAEAVLARKAQYALGLKGNHGPLFSAAEAAFAAAGELPGFETRERIHGRSEWRRATILPVARIGNLPVFPGLRAIGRIEAERRVGDGKLERSVRYAALSKALSPRQLSEVVRAHWGVENHLHWSLDVVFNEDDARTRKDNAPENLAVIRRLAYNILRAHPLPISMNRKMNRAIWSKDFFFELFAHMR